MKQLDTRGYQQQSDFFSHHYLPNSLCHFKDDFGAPIMKTAAPTSSATVNGHSLSIYHVLDEPRAVGASALSSSEQACEVALLVNRAMQWCTYFKV
jgi:hypothetical protein